MSLEIRSKEELVQKLEKFQRDVASLREEIHKIIIGQDEVIRLLLATIFSRGHCLLEGVPGLGKTMMVSTMASGDTRPYVGPSDICMMYSVTDVQGINRISEKVLANAAHALAGMIAHPPAVEPTTRPALTTG